MRVVVLTQHYVPEVTACRFRVEAFATRIAERGHEVEVIAPVPNYPEGVVQDPYRGRAVVRDLIDGVQVTYVWTYTHPSKRAIHRLGYYGSYAATATVAGSLARRPDVVFATSPPLSVPVAGSAVAARHRVPWVFDVRDLWPLAAEVIGELTDPRAIAAAERLERRLYGSAERIVAVTEAFRRYIADRGGEGKVSLIRNGTTEEWLEPPAEEPDRAKLGINEERFVWTYAGNLGPSRRLDVAIEAAERLGERFQLLVIGGGGAEERLREQADQLPEGLVRFTGLMAPKQTAMRLRASDALFVPQRRGLGDFVPSKLFDYAATGRPLIVMADGETAELAERSGASLTVEPEDADGLVAALRRLAGDRELGRRLGEAGVTFARGHSRQGQADELTDLLEECASVGRH